MPKGLTARGIVVRCPRNLELAEEAPHAYKDVDSVVDVVHRARLARKVARPVPPGVVKGQGATLLFAEVMPEPTAVGAGRAKPLGAGL